eukprot:TRINITY_DN15432_c0_g2_i2.p1 TRINITY_DN15432_c0_g2~~TRINITY_DN15432_c0_g2_i2.p1  ORF type:complete len:303 (-),score=95.28 TRINITY_DN15432_c0_g2_i2:575-1483(-)
MAPSNSMKVRADMVDVGNGADDHLAAQWRDQLEHQQQGGGRGHYEERRTAEDGAAALLTPRMRQVLSGEQRLSPLYPLGGASEHHPYTNGREDRGWGESLSGGGARAPLKDAGGVDVRALEEQLAQATAYAQGRDLEVAALSARAMAAEAALASERAAWQMEVAQAHAERDKAVRDLGRLKQHLLDMESAESEKMERDSERIADLEVRVDSRDARVAALERAVADAQAGEAEARRRAEDERRAVEQLREGLGREIEELQRACQEKEQELNNLQMALGQYYAESEARVGSGERAGSKTLGHNL